VELLRAERLVVDSSPISRENWVSSSLSSPKMASSSSSWLFSANRTTFEVDRAYFIFHGAFRGEIRDHSLLDQERDVIIVFWALCVLPTYMRSNPYERGWQILPFQILESYGCVRHIKFSYSFLGLTVYIQPKIQRRQPFADITIKYLWTGPKFFRYICWVEDTIAEKGKRPDLSGRNWVGCQNSIRVFERQRRIIISYSKHYSSHISSMERERD
jgi:hypothetical protein